MLPPHVITKRYSGEGRRGVSVCRSSRDRFTESLAFIADAAEGTDGALQNIAANGQKPEVLLESFLRSGHGFFRAKHELNDGSVKVVHGHTSCRIEEHGSVR